MGGKGRLKTKKKSCIRKPVHFWKLEKCRDGGSFLEKFRNSSWVVAFVVDFDLWHKVTILGSWRRENIICSAPFFQNLESTIGNQAPVAAPVAAPGT